LAAADHLLRDLQADMLLDHTAFDADTGVIEPLTNAGKAAVTSPKSRRTTKRDYDREVRKARILSRTSLRS
jgi:hypothetical protein